MIGILMLTLEILHQSEILMLPLGGLHMKQAVATWSLDTNSAFAVGLRKTLSELDEA
jgi:hypothetical protein